MRLFTFTLLLTFSCLLNAKTINPSVKPIESLKGNLPLPSLLLPDDEVANWEQNRSKVRARILNSWGTGPVGLTSTKNKFRIHKQYELNGHQIIEYQYQVYADQYDHGYLILPKDFDKQNKYKPFVAIHGSNKSLGGYQAIDITNAPNRAYAFEMAAKGYVAFAPSHFDYGKALLTTPQKSIRKNLLEEHPNWTVVGRQILGYIRALDMLDQLDFIEAGSYPIMGHSLGGRTALFLAALDKRVKSAVISAGVSPQHSNIYRGLRRDRSNQPYHWGVVEKNGRPIWESNEMIALVAPKPVLFVEPYNDPYNPYTGHTVEAFNSSQEVWRLYQAEADFNVFLHGDGHDTKTYIRNFAYDWLIKRDK